MSIGNLDGKADNQVDPGLKLVAFIFEPATLLRLAIFRTSPSGVKLPKSPYSFASHLAYSHEYQELTTLGHLTTKCRQCELRSNQQTQQSSASRACIYFLDVYLSQDHPIKQLPEEGSHDTYRDKQILAPIAWGNANISTISRCICSDRRCAKVGGFERFGFCISCSISGSYQHLQHKMVQLRWCSFGLIGSSYSNKIIYGRLLVVADYHVPCIWLWVKTCQNPSTKVHIQKAFEKD